MERNTAAVINATVSRKNNRNTIFMRFADASVGNGAFHV